MTEKEEEAREKIRRSINHEFSRMEDDFDVTRQHRMELVNKLVDISKKVVLTAPTDDGREVVGESTGAALQVITTTLKALADTEKANASAIMLKLKQNEQAMASSQAAKDRMAIILAATAPGKIIEVTSTESLEEHLADMFDSSIKEFELRQSNRDIAD